ncbi:hypothetical protein [Tabrizicola sp. BL-A-41-H6]|uniref:hypothetical protein n=1 Tax=Tabrizicola sp. BL-A-41-H6 TaxID=3421107 RepID=UPI003D66F3D4
MTYSMAARLLRTQIVFPPPSLRTWLQARLTEKAINRLDDRLRVDIGLPVQGFRPAPPNHVAARISMMAWR